MTVVARQSWGTTIFCDDIRTEVEGKITLVGIYPADMLVHVPFPLVIPKFGMWVRYFEVPGSLTGDGKLYVWLPGDEKASIEADIPMEQLRSSTAPNPDRDDPDMDLWVHLQMPILLAPLILKQPGRIKVRLHFGETAVRLGTLPVKAAPPKTGSVSVGNESTT
jgi:hypothetical protein